MQENHSLVRRSTQPPIQPRIHPTLVLSLGIVASSTASILIRFAQTEAPSLVIAAYRLSLATLILVPVLFSRHRSELMAMTQREIHLTLAAGGLLAVHFATWITSLEYTTVTSSVVLVQTSPLFVALLSPLLLRESLTRFTIFGLTLSLIGSLIVGLSDVCDWAGGIQCPPITDFLQGIAIKGDLLAIVGAVAVAGYILIGRHLRSRVTLIPYITLTYGAAAVVLTTMMLIAGHTPFGFTPQIYLWLILLALLPQLFAHTTYNWALRYLPAAIVSTSLLGEPVSSTILAFFILSEIPTLLRLSGATIIIVGIAVASHRPRLAMEETNTHESTEKSPRQ